MSYVFGLSQVHCEDGRKVASSRLFQLPNQAGIPLSDGHHIFSLTRKTHVCLKIMLLSKNYLIEDDAFIEKIPNLYVFPNLMMCHLKDLDCV